MVLFMSTMKGIEAQSPLYLIHLFLKNITLRISAVRTYSNRMPAITPNNCKGGTTNPKSAANGVNGSARVTKKDSTPNSINNLPGLLLLLPAVRIARMY